MYISIPIHIHTHICMHGSCIYIICMHCLRRLENWIISSGMGVTVSSETLSGCWELNLGAMQEQPVSLVTEPSLKTCLMSSLSATLQCSSKSSCSPWDLVLDSASLGSGGRDSYRDCASGASYLPPKTASVHHKSQLFQVWRARHSSAFVLVNRKTIRKLADAEAGRSWAPGKLGLHIMRLSQNK